MSFLISLPYVSDADLIACVRGMAPEFQERTYPIDNRTLNLGVAASWNLAAKEVLAGGHDWLVCCSTSTRFGPEGGRDFAYRLDRETPGAFDDEVREQVVVVEPLPPVGWHLIAWHRILLSRVGFFDENIWPAYGEDIDWSHRVLAFLGSPGRKAEQWARVPVDAWITMQGASVKLHGVVPDSDRNWAYLARKWGDPYRQVYEHPFNDPRNGLDYWPDPEERRDARMG